MQELIEFIFSIFDPTGFKTRLECGGWSDALLLVHNLSDIAIWLSYCAIPIILIVLAVRRREDKFHWISLLFAAFIVSCGFTHFIDFITSRFPIYRLSAVMRVVTAVVSVSTSVAMVWVLPKLLSLRSVAEIDVMFNKLKKDEEEFRCSIDDFRNSLDDLSAKQWAEFREQVSRISQKLVEEK